MSSSSTHLPKPKDWDDFERKMAVLVGEWLGDPNTDLNGRQGQPQNGVDIWGRNTEGDWVGVQCKKKWETEVGEAELRAEVEKAKKFRPALSQFILATSAPRDQKIQKVARELTEEDNDFPVSVWGWERIEELTAQFEKAVRAFDPNYDPVISAELKAGFAQNKRNIDALSAQLERLQSSVEEKSTPTSPETERDETTETHGKISTIQSLVEDDEIAAAERQLDKLVEKSWTEFSDSERYRATVTRANIAFHRELYDEGGALLLQAYDECPSHKSAEKNRAIGFLTLGKHAEAIEISRRLLANAPDDQHVVDTLIQARYAGGAPDPFEGIDDQFLDSEVGLILRAQIGREREDADWLQYAHEAYEKFPENKFAARHHADALIDEAIDSAAAYFLGENSNSDFSSVQSAQAILLRQLHLIDQIGGKVPAALANNAALACRLVGDFPATLECLQIGLRCNPEDSSLRDQVASHYLGENECEKAIALLEGQSLGQNAQFTLASAYVGAAKTDEAEALLEGIVPSKQDARQRHNYFSIRYELFVKLNRIDEGLQFFESRLEEDPSSIHLVGLTASMNRRKGNLDRAIELIEGVPDLVDGQTPFTLLLDVAKESARLQRNDLAVQLIFDRVATDRDNEALSFCLAAALNGDLFVSARSLLERMPDELLSEQWVWRCRIVLAHRVGDANTIRKMGEYLAEFPNDAEMRLARIGLWQRDGFESNIRRDIASVDLQAIEGTAHTKLEFLRVAARYGQASAALKLAYSILLANWQDSACHMVFHGLFIANNNLEGVDLRPSEIGANTVIKIDVGSDQRTYRIEAEKPDTFGDEWLRPSDGLATALLGRQVGDTVKIGSGMRESQAQVVEIKSVFLDTFHRSIEEFNTRFPNVHGIMRFTYDETSDDPFAEVREVTKQGVEQSMSLLEYYRDNPIPMSFLASMLGKDAIDCAIGTPAEGIPFKVCRGIAPERANAIEAASTLEGKGIVVDAITLAFIMRLKIADAVSSVCGNLFAPQSCVDVFAKRNVEAKEAVGRRQGTLSYRDGRLVLFEDTEEQLEKNAEARAREFEWVRSHVGVVETVPGSEIFGEARKTIDLVGTDACAPAIAASGAGLALLSDDFGFREWAAQNFDLECLWLQPVLMVARDRGAISAEKYCEAICQLAVAGCEYVSLDVNCFRHALRRDDFNITRDVSKLIDVLGGKNADLANNLAVAASIIDALAYEPCPHFKRLRFASEALAAFTKSRSEHAVAIASRLSAECTEARSTVSSHLVTWLLGHSIGTAQFDELREKFETWIRL